MNKNKKLGIVAVTAISVVVGAAYGSLSLMTEEVNPITAIGVLNQRTEERSRLSIDYVDKLFGPNGYANKDGKPGLSFEEQADVYARMERGLFIEGQTTFPYNPNHAAPPLERLEKAVRSYEAENQYSNN